MKNHIYNLEDLNNFFSIKRYTKKTQNVIKALFIDEMRPSDIARLTSLTPERISMIKSSFLKDYFTENNCISMKISISLDNLKDLEEFKKKCKFFLVEQISSPPPDEKIKKILKEIILPNLKKLKE